MYLDLVHPYIHRVSSFFTMIRITVLFPVRAVSHWFVIRISVVLRNDSINVIFALITSVSHCFVIRMSSSSQLFASNVLFALRRFRYWFVIRSPSFDSPLFAFVFALIRYSHSLFAFRRLIRYSHAFFASRRFDSWFAFRYSHSAIRIPLFAFRYSHSAIHIPLFAFRYSHSSIRIESLFAFVIRICFVSRSWFVIRIRYSQWSHSYYVRITSVAQFVIRLCLRSSLWIALNTYEPWYTSR
jgi:hypothetical protein